MTAAERAREVCDTLGKHHYPATMTGLPRCRACAVIEGQLLAHEAEVLEQERWNICEKCRHHESLHVGVIPPPDDVSYTACWVGCDCRAFERIMRPSRDSGGD